MKYIHLRWSGINLTDQINRCFGFILNVINDPVQNDMDGVGYEKKKKKKNTDLKRDRCSMFMDLTVSCAYAGMQCPLFDAYIQF